jgi:hypothetical protein
MKRKCLKGTEGDMRATVLILVLLAKTLIACAQKNADSSRAPIMEFIGGRSFDFGEVPQGPDVEHLFEFVNRGKSPLLMSRVVTSGGPDYASWDKKPVMPGKRGSILYHYRTIGHVGYFFKTVYVYANTGNVNRLTDSLIRLSIKGKVIGAK